MNRQSAVKSRNIVISRIGKLFRWSLQAVSRHPFLAIASIILLVILITMPYYYNSEFWIYRFYFWSAAAILILLIGIVLVAAGLSAAFQKLFAAQAISLDAVRKETDLLVSDVRKEVQAVSSEGDILRARLDDLIRDVGPSSPLEHKVSTLVEKVETLAESGTAMTGRLDAYGNSIAEIREKANALAEQLAASIKETTANITKRLDADNRSIAEIGEKANVLAEQLAAIGKKLGDSNAEESFAQRLDANQNAIGTVSVAVANITSKLDAESRSIVEIGEKADTLAKQLAAVDKKLGDPKAEGSVAQRMEASRKAIGTISDKVANITVKLDQNLPFQNFNRILTQDHIETLLTVWNERLGLQVTKPSLAYLAHRIRTLEQNSLGRLATEIQAAVLRTLVSSAVRSEKLEILEIGTLFGVGLAMLYEYNIGRYERIHVTALDPLDGYYKENVPDSVLNIPVTRATFWRNMETAGIPREDVTLIPHLSTTSEAMEATGKKKYDLLVIDGDHTYDGVKADFDNYHMFVADDGYIIFDDYGTTAWPDVKSFVDAEVMPRDDFIFIGAEWRTAIFKASAKAASKSKRHTTTKRKDAG